MELNQIKLSEKAEKEIVKAVKLGALAGLTEESENLITTEDIAVYISRHYNTVANKITKLPSFPKPVTIEGRNAHPLFIAGEVVRWVKRNAKRI